VKASSTRNSAGICRSRGATWPLDELFRRFDVFLPEFASLNILASKKIHSCSVQCGFKGGLNAVALNWPGSSCRGGGWKNRSETCRLDPYL